MTVLWIILAILALFAAVVFAPVRFDFSFNGEPFYKLLVYGITVYKKQEKPDKITILEKPTKKTKKAQKAQEPKPDFFTELKNERGFLGAIQFCASLAMMLIKKLCFFIKKLRFSRFCLDVSVASEDAAKTAIEYGAVCSAVYPVLALLTTTAKFKSKSINVSTDFDNCTPQCSLSFSVGTRVINALIVAVTALSDYNKMKRNVNTSERK